MLKGSCGTDFENLRDVTDDIDEAEDYDIDYYDFIGTPKFAKDITVRADKEPVDDEPTEPDDTDATGSKPNPGGESHRGGSGGAAAAVGSGDGEGAGGGGV